MRALLPIAAGLSLLGLVAGCAADDPAPTAKELGDAVVRYNHIRPGGSMRFSVTADGKASTLRRGERVVITLPPAELDRLRRDLVHALDGHEGTIDRTEGKTDQPVTEITVVGPDKAIHHVRAEGGPQSVWFTRAADRLRTLIDRTTSHGAVDTSAPILVSIFDDPNTTPVRTAIWPTTIAPPAMTSPPVSQGHSVHHGDQAAQLRAVLGTATDRVQVRLPSGRTLIAYWSAMLPGF